MGHSHWKAESDDAGEHRRFPRLPCGGTADVRVLPNGSKQTGSLADLSKRGCCFLSDEPLRGCSGSNIEVHLKVRGIDLQVAGVIRHVHQRLRAGIEFVELSERKCEQIEELIRELTVARTLAAQSRREAHKLRDERNLSLDDCA
jgi:PilZ domain-containing protein